MSQRSAQIGLVVAVALMAVVALPSSVLGAAPSVVRCTLSGIGHVQICPVGLKATAGKSSNVVVARYSDFSHCHLPAPEGQLGQDTEYLVASVTITWGDGSHPSSGIAHRHFLPWYGQHDTR